MWLLKGLAAVEALPAIRLEEEQISCEPRRLQKKAADMAEADRYRRTGTRAEAAELRYYTRNSTIKPIIDTRAADGRVPVGCFFMGSRPNRRRELPDEKLGRNH